MHPSPGMNDQGDVHIPFMYPATEIPFARWQMVTEKVFSAEKPVVIQSVIITHKGEVFVQYAMEVNDESEYPQEGQETQLTIETTKRSYVKGNLVDAEEKRRYE